MHLPESIIEDLDGDGIKEIYFSIMTGFSTRPRNLFAFDPSNGQMKVSPESCAAFDQIPTESGNVFIP